MAKHRLFVKGFNRPVMEWTDADDADILPTDYYGEIVGKTLVIHGGEPMNAKEREVLDERYEQMVRLHADMIHAVNDNGTRMRETLTSGFESACKWLGGIFILMNVLIILVWRM